MTFTPNIQPSIKSSGESKTRVLEANFGDGYSQRVSDGLNAVLDTWSLVWDLLPTAEYQNIIAFFENKKGAESFDYVLPGELSSKKFICQQWKKGFPVPEGYRNLTATFKEVADI